jgi:hypothetical protein
MVFLEMAAAIGDMLSFYQDTQLKESLLAYATEKKNVISLAQTLGYKPKIATPAVVTLTIYQLVPSTGTGQSNKPDERFYLNIKSGMEIESKGANSVTFRTVDDCDFANATDRTIEVYENDRDTVTGEPTKYLITKKVKAISATEVTTTATFGSYTEYPTFTINDSNIIEISSVTDSDGYKWYEVPYLAQETLFLEKANTEANSNLSQYNSTVPYIIEVTKVPKRFSVKVNSDDSITLQFGSGNTALSQENLIPNPKNVGLGLANSISQLEASIDPSNFLKTNTFGIAPVNTTLTIKYLVGGGVESNVNVGELTSIRKVEFNEDLLSIDASLINAYNETKNSVAAENLEAARGGRGSESVEEVRQNALGAFGSQNRAVTLQDYTVRALSMPEKYGSVAKVFVIPDNISTNPIGNYLKDSGTLTNFISFVQTLQGKTTAEIETAVTQYIENAPLVNTSTTNPFAINMHVLGYDSDKKLATINQAVKQNLKTYISEYKMLADTVNIIDGYIVNIAVEFEIAVFANYNKLEVLANTLLAVESFFEIDKWTFNKPINISELELAIANVEGVLSIPNLKITNICGNGYSPIQYNIETATKNKIVYPSLDPAVFEVKYPKKDIKGKVI